MGTLLDIGLGNALAAAVLTPLVALAAGAASRARRPALAHGLWLLVLLKLVTPPPFAVALPWPAGPEARTPEAPVAIPDPAPADAPDGLADADAPDAAPAFAPDPGGREPDPIADPSPVEAPPAIATPAPGPARSWPWSARDTLGAAWLAGAAAWLGIVASRIGRFRRALRLAGRAPEDVRERVAALATAIGLRRPPEVALVDGPISPLVWALGGRAKLVVPRGLWGRLDDEQRDAMLLHELAHLRRRDHWVRVVELVATGLYGWHPALWWARRGLHEAEEQCCDAWVVWARPESARTYATALVEAVDYLSAARLARLPVGASGMGRLRHISRRITMIMKGQTPRALSWLGAFTLLALAAMLLPWLPTWGQSPREPAAAPGFNPEDVRRATDEVEILANQVELKKALVRKAEAGRNIARSSSDQTARLEGRRVVSGEESAKARALLEIAEADVDVAKAELRESELRLTQARRRLAALTAVEADRPARRGGSADEAPIPAGRTVEAPAPPDRSTIHHLKQIGLALHNYHAVHGRFPPPAIAGPDGTPLLSWRVALLPFLEGGDALYREFRLDEPWDSPTNARLIARMPETFRTHHPDGQTALLAPVGPGTLWDGPQGQPIAAVPDGTSNTIAVVEADRPVPWTKPEDLDYPASGSFQHLYGSGFVALFTDGSVRDLQPTDPMTFHALFTRAGGEVIDHDRLSASPVPPGRPPYQPPPTAALVPDGGMGPGAMMSGGYGGMGMAMMGGRGMAAPDAEGGGGGRPMPGGMGRMPGGGAAPGAEGMTGMMRGRMGAMPGGMAPAASPDRIAELEARIDQLRRENADLRSLLRHNESAPSSPTPDDPPPADPE